MKYVLRDYQKAASLAAVRCLTGEKKENGILVLPTGSGKSLIIADIAAHLTAPLIVLQPSKEILEQNYAKYLSYGFNDAAIYSASAGRKDIGQVTFAMIGSVMNHMNEFSHFKNVLIDECHNVKPTDGMYKKFIQAADRRVVGLTATPYRLKSYQFLGSELKFLTRTRPRIFDKVLYFCQISDLLAKGFLAKLRYFDLTEIDLNNVKSNSTGADYDEKSLIREYERTGFYGKVIAAIRRVSRPKNGVPRKGILVFTRFVREAEMIMHDIPHSAIVTGTTPKKDREDILQRFKSGEIKVVANVGTLTTGFDYPALDTVILARPTKSLALYYQMVGRAIRPCKDKDGWVIDLCGNYKRFGDVADLKVDVEKPKTERWCITSNGKQLTNVFY